MIFKLKSIFCFHYWVYDARGKRVQEMLTGKPCLIFYKVCTKCKKVATFACNGEF